MINTANLTPKRSFGNLDQAGKKKPITPASTPVQGHKPLTTSPSDLMQQLMKLKSLETQADAFTRADHELNPPATKRSKPLTLEIDEPHTTEARIERGSFRPDNLFTEPHRITGLVEMPKVGFPSAHPEEDDIDDQSLPGSQSDEPDAVFSFLLDALGNTK